MKRAMLLLPLAVFLLMAVFLYRGLYLDPKELRSVLIDKPLPSFSQDSLEEPGRIINSDELKGQPALLNVWATWCPTCKAEHEMLNRLAAQGVAIYGINYKDDSAAAREWLQRLGNPYRFNIEDPQGSLGIDLGVYGAPETFLLDKQGIIRAKHVGAIDENVWRSKLAPLYQQLLDEATP